MKHGPAALACRMDMHDGQAVWKSIKNMHQEHAAWTCDVDIEDIQHGRAARTFSVDLQHRHLACSVYMQHVHALWRHEHAAWTLDKQHGHVTCTFSMDMQHGHAKCEHAARTCSMDISLNMQRRHSSRHAALACRMGMQQGHAA
jgi:hypothetical protein